MRISLCIFLHIPPLTLSIFSARMCVRTYIVSVHFRGYLFCFVYESILRAEVCSMRHGGAREYVLSFILGGEEPDSLIYVNESAEL